MFSTRTDTKLPSSRSALALLTCLALAGGAIGAADRGTAATGDDPPAATVDVGPLPRSPELTEHRRLEDRRAVVIGERAYSTWTEDGLYPAMGFHTRGEMGGIWSPPIKLLDGLWFGVDGQWLGDDVERVASARAGGTHAPTTPPATACACPGPTSCRTVHGRAGRADAAQRQRHDGSAGGGRALRADGDLPVGGDDAQPAGGQRRRHRRRRRPALVFREHGRRRPSARGARLGGRGRERPHAGRPPSSDPTSVDPRTPRSSARPPARPRPAARTLRRHRVRRAAPAACSATTSRCRRTRP